MKDHLLHLTISSPEKEIYDGEITLITLPGTLGSFNVLPNHAPIVSTLKQGEITYVLPDKSEQKIAVKDGFIELSNNRLSVCVTL